MKWSDFLRRYVHRKTVKQPFLRLLAHSRALNHGLNRIRPRGGRDQGCRPLKDNFTRIWAVPFEGGRMALLTCVGHEEPRDATVTFDQFNIPSGPVFGVHFTLSPGSTTF